MSNAQSTEMAIDNESHVYRGKYRISADKNGRMVAHEWRRLACRWVRCNLREALAAKGNQ